MGLVEVLAVYIALAELEKVPFGKACYKNTNRHKGIARSVKSSK